MANTIELEVKQFETDSVASFKQLNERQQILDVYVNLFTKAIHKKIAGETFETILEELMERHIKLLPLAIKDGDLIVSELNVIGAFERLFELRGVEEIVKQIQCVNETMFIHVHSLKRSSEGKLLGIFGKYSLDTTELEARFPQLFYAEKYPN